MRQRSVPEEIMPSLFSCVGMIVVNWTFIENALDGWACAAFHDYPDLRVEKELPRQFGRKLDFLRKSFRRIPGLSPFESEALAFLDRARELSGVRDSVVHGTLSDFDPQDEVFTFSKIDLTKDKRQHVFGELRIRGADLVSAADELLAMAAQAQELSLRLLKLTEAQDNPG